LSQEIKCQVWLPSDFLGTALACAEPCWPGADLQALLGSWAPAAPHSAALVWGEGIWWQLPPSRVETEPQTWLPWIGGTRVKRSGSPGSPAGWSRPGSELSGSDRQVRPGR